MHATTTGIQQGLDGVISTLYRNHETGTFFTQQHEATPKDLFFRLSHKWVIKAGADIATPVFCDSPNCGLCSTLTPSA